MGILPDEEYNAVLTVLRLAEEKLEVEVNWLDVNFSTLTKMAQESMSKRIEEEQKRLNLAKDLFVRFELIKQEDVK